MKPFVESNDLSNDGEALRGRAERDGYLFLRNWVDKEAVLAARRDIAGCCWMRGGSTAGRILKKR